MGLRTRLRKQGAAQNLSQSESLLRFSSIWAQSELRRRYAAAVTCAWVLLCRSECLAKETSQPYLKLGGGCLLCGSPPPALVRQPFAVCEHEAGVLQRQTIIDRAPQQRRAVCALQSVQPRPL